MRVNIVGTLPDKDREMHRGPERTTIGLAEALSRRGHDVTVWADEGHPHTVNVESHVLVPDADAGIGRMMKFIRWFREEDPDGIVHTWRPLHNCDVFSYHGIGMAEEMNKQFGTFGRRFLWGAKIHRWAKRWAAHRATQAIVTSPGNIRYAQKYNMPADTIVPVGVEEKFIQDDEYDGQIDVLTVGRAEERKQPHFVCQETPDGYTTVAAGGEGNTDYMDHLNDRWEGRVSEERLLRLYRDAGVFVLPSYFEPFGLTAAEAMAAGTPVVVSNNACIASWVCEHKLGGVYTWNDPESYERELRMVLNNRDQFSKNAKEFAQDFLSWDTIAEDYEYIYENLDTIERWRSSPDQFLGEEVRT